MDSITTFIAAVSVTLLGGIAALILVRLSVFGELKSLRAELAALRTKNDTLADVNINLQRGIWERDLKIAAMETQIQVLRNEIGMLQRGDHIG